MQGHCAGYAEVWDRDAVGIGQYTQRPPGKKLFFWWALRKFEKTQVEKSRDLKNHGKPRKTQDLGQGDKTSVLGVGLVVELTNAPRALADAENE